MYRTANNIEELDMRDELNSFDSVGYAEERGANGFHSAHDSRNNQADFYIIMIDDSEVEEILQTLKDCGYSAYLEYDDGLLVKKTNWPHAPMIITNKINQ